MLASELIARKDEHSTLPLTVTIADIDQAIRIGCADCLG